MKKKLIWILSNGLFFILAYFAYIEKIEGAYNILMVFSWLIVCITFLYLSDSAIETLKNEGRSFPRGIGLASDIILSMIFAFYGNYILSVFWLVHMLIQDAAHSKAEELNKKEKDNVI